MSSPSARHERIGFSSTRTVQVPHSPSSQPCLVPVSPRSSRSTSSNVLWGKNATSTSSPLSLNPIRVFRFPFSLSILFSAYHGDLQEKLLYALYYLADLTASAIYYFMVENRIRWGYFVKGKWNRLASQPMAESGEFHDQFCDLAGRISTLETGYR